MPSPLRPVECGDSPSPGGARKGSSRRDVQQAIRREPERDTDFSLRGARQSAGKWLRSGTHDNQILSVKTAVR